MSKITTLPKQVQAEDLELLAAPDRPEYIPYVQPIGDKKRPGWLFHRNTLFGSVLTKSEGPVHGMPEFTFGGFFNQNKNVRLPAELLSQAHGYFQWAFETMGIEAVVLITADWDDKFHLYCPDQINTHSGVDYTVVIEDLPPDQTVVGSIHSHCDFGAFHSGTDTHDADGTDGLHITLGHVDRDIAEFNVMFSFSKIKWQNWPLEDVIDGPQPPAGDFPEEWKSRIQRYVHVPKAIYTSFGYGYDVEGWDEETIEAYQAWLRNDADDSKFKPPKIPSWEKPKHKEKKIIHIKSSDYLYGLPERAIRLLRSDLALLANELADIGVSLEFDVSERNSISSSRKNKR